MALWALCTNMTSSIRLATTYTGCCLLLQSTVTAVQNVDSYVVGRLNAVI
jgi:hypothetical protein